MRDLAVHKEKGSDFLQYKGVRFVICVAKCTIVKDNIKL